MARSTRWIAAGWLCTLLATACLSNDPIGSGPAATPCGAVTCSEAFMCVTTVAPGGVSDSRCVLRGGCDLCACRAPSGCAGVGASGSFACEDLNGQLTVTCTQ